MIIKPNFRNVSILLVDSDTILADVVVHMLRAMGFNHVKHVKTASEAVRMMHTQPVSFVITEWDLKDQSGIALVRYLRTSPESPNRSIPIVMLTGRGEQPDVEKARDTGITEFVIKPFSASTLFARIDQIIDHPRSFVLSQGYVGPERRRRGNPPEGVGERRSQKPVIVTNMRDFNKKEGDPAPLIVQPDFSIRLQMNIVQPLKRLITPEILQEAQYAINVMGDESYHWIMEDLQTIRQAYEGIKVVYSPHHLESIKEAALSIKARSGTFGYTMASDVARLLYLFLCMDFVPGNPRHPIVIEKHIEVLTVILAQKIKDRPGVGNELYAELERLIELHR